MIKAEREYRNLGLFSVEQRDGETEPSFFVEGYASTFDAYPLFTEDGVTYCERIDPRAFNGADMSDVVFLRDHSGRVLARTKNGSITLNIDDKGLHTRTNLGLTGAAREMHEDINAGNYTQMSFAFTVAEDHYERESHTRVIDRIAKLFDISAVAFPANPYTDIGVSARDYFNGAIEAERAERLEAEKRNAQIRRIKLLLEVTK